MTIWKCEWCGKSFELGPPSVDRYCSPKCYKESGQEEIHQRIAERKVAERRAEQKKREEERRKEEERWNSLSKEEQEAELEAKRLQEEEKQRKIKVAHFAGMFADVVIYGGAAFIGLMILAIFWMLFFR